MKIYFDGDSWTKGNDLDEDIKYTSRFSALVSKELGAEEYNISKSGRSNHRIVRHLLIENDISQYDLAIIQMSFPNRMEFFDSRIIALTSSEDDLKKISKNFRTTFELVNPSTSNYLVEHSSNLYIIDKGLTVKRIIANGLPSSEITKTVKKLLN